MSSGFNWNETSGCYERETGDTLEVICQSDGEGVATLLTTNKSTGQTSVSPINELLIVDEHGYATVRYDSVKVLIDDTKMSSSTATTTKGGGSITLKRSNPLEFDYSGDDGSRMYLERIDGFSKRDTDKWNEFQKLQHMIPNTVANKGDDSQYVTTYRIVFELMTDTSVGYASSGSSSQKSKTTYYGNGNSLVYGSNTSAVSTMDVVEKFFEGGNMTASRRIGDAYLGVEHSAEITAKVTGFSPRIYRIGKGYEGYEDESDSSLPSPATTSISDLKAQVSGSRTNPPSVSNALNNVILLNTDSDIIPNASQWRSADNKAINGGMGFDGDSGFNTKELSNDEKTSLPDRIEVNFTSTDFLSSSPESPSDTHFIMTKTSKGYESKSGFIIEKCQNSDGSEVWRMMSVSSKDGVPVLRTLDSSPIDPSHPAIGDTMFQGGGLSISVPE